MATTKQILESVDDHLAESMGDRAGPTSVQLAPTPCVADIGRRPAPQFGHIEVDRLLPDPSQPRSVFDEEAIKRLAASLQNAGQLAPIRARWSEAHGKWLIVAGERRWRAAQYAALETIECYFYQQALDDGEILRLQLVENLLRENLRPIEEARGFLRLMEQQGYNGKRLAAELSVPESKVSRSLALLKLADDVQQQVESGRIAPRVAYEISKVKSQAEQRRLASQVESGRMGVQEINRETRRSRKRGSSRQRGVHLTFPLPEGWTIAVSRRSSGNYYEVEQALVDALEEVRARIRGGVQLF